MVTHQSNAMDAHAPNRNSTWLVVGVAVLLFIALMTFINRPDRTRVVPNLAPSTSGVATENSTGNPADTTVGH